MSIHIHRNSFNAGEISQRMDARVDEAKYGFSCRILENFIPGIYGGAFRRPGTIYTGTARNVAEWTEIEVNHTPSLLYGGDGTGTGEYLHTIINLWPRLGLEQRMTFTAVSRNYSETTAYHTGGGWVPGATGDVDGFKITTSSEGSYTFDITKWRVFGR